MSIIISLVRVDRVWQRWASAALLAAFGMVQLAACGSGNPLNNSLCPGPFQDQEFDNCGAGGGCACGRPMVSKQNPIITTVGQCTLKSFGTVTWDVRFSLPNPATTCGWVIQMITHTDSNGKQEQYWEAFYIAQNATTTTYEIADDEFGTPAMHPSKGTETFQGIARFYEGTLPSDFVYCDSTSGNSPATGRRFTRTKPSWWDGSGTSHNLTVMWDCSDIPTTCSVQTDPPDACANPCQCS